MITSIEGVDFDLVDGLLGVECDSLFAADADAEASLEDGGLSTDTGVGSEDLLPASRCL